jgi:hypothetical protein
VPNILWWFHGSCLEDGNLYAGEEETWNNLYNDQDEQVETTMVRALDGVYLADYLRGRIRSPLTLLGKSNDGNAI